MIEMNIEHTEPAISQVQHSTNHSMFGFLLLIFIISIGLTAYAFIYTTNYMVNINFLKNRIYI